MFVQQKHHCNGSDGVDGCNGPPDSHGPQIGGVLVVQRDEEIQGDYTEDNGADRNIEDEHIRRRVAAEDNEGCNHEALAEGQR